ncbi:MAG: glycolate oxidase subunit GlcF [Telluria sp.]
MQTNLADFIKDTAQGEEADRIIRQCVHCGFCNATCPTYQLLGDELDGPRGRIYRMKQVREGARATASTQMHLDRCLSCRNCETTCPSGVQYTRLLDIGRKIVDGQVRRPWKQRAMRDALKLALPRKWLFTPALKAGQAVRALLPASLRTKVPAAQHAGHWPHARHARKMLLLDGCVQPAMAPNINSATARVLDALGIELQAAPRAGCCGAIRYHLDDHEGGLDDMRRNIDAWWPLVEQGAEAIVMTASGCGLAVKDYGRLLAHDPAYAQRARRISALTRDVSEIVAEAETPLRQLLDGKRSEPVAFHAPCTLQHGQQIRGKVEAVLRCAGVEVQHCADSHLCCGSAGTYSVLEPVLSQRLRDDKLAKLEAGKPHLIVSANVGCISHLQGGTATPVRHWIELIDAVLAGSEEKTPESIDTELVHN